MASIFVSAGAEENKEHQMVSPRNIKRTWSTNSSSSSACGHGHQAGTAAPKCVCAPATHARSFKCRLHRVNSHGHSAPPPSSAPPSAATAPSTRTVEAQ